MTGFQIQGLRYTSSDSGFEVNLIRFRVQGAPRQIQVSEYTSSDSGFRVHLIRFVPRGLISAGGREEGVEDVAVIRQESFRWLARLSGAF